MNEECRSENTEPCLASAFCILPSDFGSCRADGARGKSGGGPPHSRTLARWRWFSNRAERLGVRQSSGALAGHKTRLTKL